MPAPKFQWAHVKLLDSEKVGKQVQMQLNPPLERAQVKAFCDKIERMCLQGHLFGGALVMTQGPNSESYGSQVGLETRLNTLVDLTEAHEAGVADVEKLLNRPLHSAYVVYNYDGIMLAGRTRKWPFDYKDFKEDMEQHKIAKMGVFSRAYLIGHDATKVEVRSEETFEKAVRMQQYRDFVKELEAEEENRGT